jgi:hypothetical protein
LFWVAPLIGRALGGLIYRWLSEEPVGVIEGKKTAYSDYARGSFNVAGYDRHAIASAGAGLRGNDTYFFESVAPLRLTSKVNGNPSVAILEKLATALRSTIPEFFVVPSRGEPIPRSFKGGRKRSR